jgi:hypothetical protein
MPPALFPLVIFQVVFAFFAWGHSQTDPSAYGLSHSWDHRRQPLCPAYSSSWSLVNFLLTLALGGEPPDLHVLSSWDYRCEPPFFGFHMV